MTINNNLLLLLCAHVIILQHFIGKGGCYPANCQALKSARLANGGLGLMSWPNISKPGSGEGRRASMNDELFYAGMATITRILDNRRHVGYNYGNRYWRRYPILTSGDVSLKNNIVLLKNNKKIFNSTTRSIL